MHTVRFTCLALCLLGCASSLAADFPQRKEGLWEMSAENPASKHPMPPMKQCIDAKSDAEMQKHALQGGGGPGRSECEKHSFKKTATGWEADAVCKHGTTTATIHSVITGDFANTYTIDSQTHFDPPMNGTADARHKVTVRWLGACPSGWKGGDMEVNGRRFNALEMQKQAGMQPGGRMTPEQMKQMVEAMKKQQGAQ
ncbi:DUF3617 family protein [Niveibacterium umoris]|uniref:DUF3617 family protein n=1 Tax=Niveibacterium umoris TaxID=1193620 RepID=A0A840BRK8_9RHOO|nr:DUF3617 family protein [Niveibacterium umoris]MBB4014168.1 hypothetical protein [Niveibacterium umoris]